MTERLTDEALGWGMYGEYRPITVSSATTLRATPADATAALTARLDAEWNEALEALRKAVIARFEISPITVGGTTVYGHGMIIAHPLLHEIDALRRNPKEGKSHE